MLAAAAERCTPVPFLDLGLTHGALKAEILAEIGAIIDANAFINGPHVARFEEEFAAYCGVPRAIGLASGLDALRLALLALELEPGDEVVVPAMTFAATFEAVTQAGATPVVADIRDDDYGLDPEAAAAVAGARTRILMPVHLYGQMADVQGLQSLARRLELEIVEDACQAHGAERDGIRAGAAGVAGAFSFYPGKNLGAMGDAGALVTSSARLGDHVQALREHGQTAKYVHSFEGYTARLDTIQAAILSCKLRHLDQATEQRRQAAALYGELLGGVGDLRLPDVPAGSSPVWHLYVVRTEARDALRSYLDARRIGAGLHYPEPPHLSEAYRFLGHSAGDFPRAEALAREAISLPIFPGITNEQIATVADAVSSFFSGV